MMKCLFHPPFTITSTTRSRSFFTLTNSILMSFVNASHSRSIKWLASPSPTVSVRFNIVRWKHKLDKSRIPVLNENDLEEQFIKGSGPGGQHVNKRVNCCFLKHKPTGIVVKCHHSRTLEENRQLARQILIDKLDDHFNGDMSIRAQKERLLEKKSEKAKQKSSKLSEQKRKYQELLDLDKSVSETSDSKPS